MDIKPRKKIKAWTFNGTVPGEQLRVKEGEVVKAILANKLDEPVTIHWHGVPVPNTQDGIPGVTQDAVLPEETYTYEFVADDPGTHWYYTHQNGVEQLDKGLYGTLSLNRRKAYRPTAIIHLFSTNGSQEQVVITVTGEWRTRATVE